MTETEALARFITATLNAADIEHSVNAAPQGFPLPVVVWQILGGDDITTNDQVRNGSEIPFQMKAVDQSEDNLPAMQAYGAAHEALDFAEGEAGGYEIDVRRVGTIELPLVENGVHWQNTGGTYVALVRPIPS
jgi:hypothetical protein